MRSSCRGRHWTVLHTVVCSQHILPGFSVQYNSSDCSRMLCTLLARYCWSSWEMVVLFFIYFVLLLGRLSEFTKIALEGCLIQARTASDFSICVRVGSLSNLIHEEQFLPLSLVFRTAMMWKTEAWQYQQCSCVWAKCLWPKGDTNLRPSLRLNALNPGMSISEGRPNYVLVQERANSPCSSFWFWWTLDRLNLPTHIYIDGSPLFSLLIQMLISAGNSLTEMVCYQHSRYLVET